MENNFCPHCGADLRTTKLCVEDEMDNKAIAFGCLSFCWNSLLEFFWLYCLHNQGFLDWCFSNSQSKIPFKLNFGIWGKNVGLMMK